MFSSSLSLSASTARALDYGDIFLGAVHLYGTRRGRHKAVPRQMSSRRRVGSVLEGVRRASGRAEGREGPERAGEEGRAGLVASWWRCRLCSTRVNTSNTDRVCDELTTGKPPGDGVLPASEPRRETTGYCQVHAGEEGHARPGGTTPRRGQDSPIRMTEDRDKWRKYVHGVANRGIEDGFRTEQNCQCVISMKSTGGVLIFFLRP